MGSIVPPGYDVRLVDLNVERLRKRDIETADIIFISGMIVQKQSFAEVVDLCHRCGKPVVAGGPYAMCSHDKITGVDHFVLGEAELSLPAFSDDLESNRLKPIYQATQKADTALTPAPKWELVDVDRYFSLPLQFSRGCPYECEFCDITSMFGRVPRTKGVEQFIAEITGVYRTRFRGPVFIVDDNFVGNSRKVKTLLKRMIEWQRDHRYPFRFFTEASINLAEDGELLDLMQEAAFDMVFVGIESPEKETLVNAGKSQNTRNDLVDSVRRIQKHGMEVTGGFILGFDDDTEHVFDRQIEFIHRAGIPAAMIGLLTAIPSTQLHSRLAKTGRLLDDTTGDSSFNLELNFIPRMPRDVLIRGYRRVLARLYAPENFFRRCMTLLRQMPSSPTRSIVITGTEIRAFIHSIVRQTVSSGGAHYLRFLFWVLLRAHRLFPQAIALAVKGHHFFKLKKRI